MNIQKTLFNENNSPRSRSFKAIAIVRRFWARASQLRLPKTSLLFLLCAFGPAFATYAEATCTLKCCRPNVIPLDAEDWNTQRDVTFLDFDGRPTIALKGSFMEPGLAEIEGVDFTDGMIEFDMWIEYENAIFTGIQFRLDEAAHKWEYVYFRPGANHQYNAFQYYPHYKKEMTWQLYGQHQRAVDLPVGDWFHLRIEVKGRSMACTLNDQSYPFFFTDRLLSGSDRGSIRFVSSSEVYISNVVVTPSTQATLKPFNPTRWDLEPRYLTTWWVSQPIVLEQDELQVGLERFDSDSEWIAIHAEDQGLISFTRYIDQPGPNSAVLAQCKIESESEQKKWLSFGYSDRMDVFLNGELIFSGDNSYRTPTSKMRSRVHQANDGVELNLKKGENLLQTIVYERSGGWGMITQLSDIEGISFAK